MEIRYSSAFHWEEKASEAFVCHKIEVWPKMRCVQFKLKNNLLKSLQKQYTFRVNEASKEEY